MSEGYWTRDSMKRGLKDSTEFHEHLVKSLLHSMKRGLKAKSVVNSGLSNSNSLDEKRIESLIA